MDDGFLEFLKNRQKELEEEKQAKRPEMLAKAVPFYDHECSRIPDRIRVSFADGHTEIYQRAVEQPAPLIEENIRIIRKWAVGYKYKPPRRRRR